MKKKVRYAFGGFKEGDGKNPRKVDNIPDGYTEEPIDPAFPNRRYYRKEGSTASTIVKPITTVRKTTSATIPSKQRILRPSQSTNHDIVPKQTSQSFLDRVFIENNPITPVVQPTPVEAFMGDTVADLTGKTIGRLLNRSRNLAVGAGTNDTSQEVADFMYTQPDVKGAPVDSARGKFTLNTKELQDIFGTGRVMNTDVSTYKTKPMAKFAIGGQVGASLINQLGAPILDSLMGLLEGTNDYSNQPIINAATMKNMATPYKFALGGSVEDLDEDELFELQQEADEQGITIEELLEQKMLEEEEDMTSDPDEEIIEDGEEVVNEEEGFDYEDEKDEDPISEYALGGKVIEVEDDEVVEHPNGRMVEMDGNTHEEGGIKINAQEGTKIYSDRLSVDGKTMAERKKNREKSIAKLNKLGEESLSNPLKNTIKRTSQIHEMEEQQDMALQELAGKIYGQPGEAKYGYNGNPYMYPTIESEYDPRIGQYDLSIEGTEPINRTIGSNTMKLPTTNSMGLRKEITTPATIENGESASALGVGDYVGLAGNLFNAFAPIVNSNNAAAATKPVINRFKGFGKDALDANQAAQSHAQTSKTNAQTDINTSTNSAIARNRNGARGINTLRALDIATNIGANKAKNATESTFANQLIGLLGQRGQLENQQDMAEMRGQTMADDKNASNLDNYFSNNAQNLVNIGANVQGIGRNLNKARANQDNIDLVGLMSQNGIKLGRKKGRYTIINS